MTALLAAGPTGKTRAGVREIVPGQLYQRGQFLSWPAADKRRTLDELGVTVVVNLWHKVDSDLATTDHDRLYLTWHISPTALPKDWAAVVNFLLKLLRSGHVLLIHCEAGRARSVWLCAWLMSGLLKISPADALAQVEDLVKGADLHGPLREQLLHWTYEGMDGERGRVWMHSS